jgi:hypothetical protein
MKEKEGRRKMKFKGQKIKQKRQSKYKMGKNKEGGVWRMIS